jgi:sterol desaturase/sphingolipid hydroxylase (fatty acid hydroxylase superfamily)
MEWLVYPALMLVFAVFFTREVIAPASRNHCDRRWLLLACGLGIVTMLSTVGIGLAFGAAIRDRAWLPLPPQVPDPLVGLASFFCTSFIFYWWHRATHRFDTLWRHVHQLHHSARRIEALTAFFAHPLEAASAAVIGGFSSYIVLGGSGIAAAWALLFAGVFDLFLHADIQTPRWLGYLVQRPEMHRVHHAHEHHADNYGLPLWDLLFGTWHNPRDGEPLRRCGFDDDKSDKLCEMLLGQDVHAPPA